MDASSGECHRLTVMESDHPDPPSRTAAAKRPAAGPASIVVCIVLVIGILYFARDILIPIALAILLTFLLAPLVLRLQRWGLSRVPAVILVALFAFSVIGATGWLVVEQVMDLSSDLPRYKQNIITKIQTLRGSVGGGANGLSGTIKEIGQAMQGASTQPAIAEVEGDGQAQGEFAGTAQLPPTGAPRGSTPDNPLYIEPVEPESSPFMPLLQNLGVVTGPLGTAAVVLIFTIFMLIGREDLRDRFLQLIGQDQLNVTTQAMDEAARRVSRYLLMQSIVNGTYGLAVAIGLLLLGVPSALLWGLLAALLRFIPYVGPWIAATLPIALSFAVSTTWTIPLLTVGLFVVLELISNNIIEPWLYGSGTGISTMAILVAAIFWTWLWGPIGLLLSTPLTVCVVVMGRYVPQLTFLGTLLGDESALPPASRYYQRLLAMDEVEATEVAKDYLEEHQISELYDSVLLPALGLAEQDGHRGTLTRERQEFIRQTTRELVEELGRERTLSGSTDVPPAERSTKARVICLPARDEADEIASSMFAHLLGLQGIPARAPSSKGLAGEALEAIDRERPEVICISALPPFAITHARYICKRLRQRFPQLKIIVGLWNARVSSKKVREQLSLGVVDEVVSTFSQAVEQVRQLLAPVASPMNAPPIPPDEEQRLAELKKLDLLDTPPEQVFDRYTSRLATIFNAPISLMSLIDENRQWWKSHVGLPPELAEARSTARELSVCAHVVGNNEMLVVDDTALDERFANNPLIQQTGIRFYAGAPLRAGSGHPIGSLCVIDTKPRHLTETEKQLLQLIAEDVMTEVKLRDVSRKMTSLTEQVVAHAAVIKKDLDQARAVQRFLLPSEEQSGQSCSACYVYEPAAQIGGDFVDVLCRPDGSTVVVVADAIGHGASAALLSVMIKSAFIRVASTATEPHEVLAAIQRDLQPIVEPGRFITAIAAIKPSNTDYFLIASAGHYAPVLIGEDNATLIEIENTSPLLVDSSQAISASARVPVKPHDRVLFFTDGAVEVLNEAKELLGAKGLLKIIQQHARLHGKELLRAIHASVTEFAGSTSAENDITLLVLEVTSSCEPSMPGETRSGVKSEQGKPVDVARSA